MHRLALFFIRRLSIINMASLGKMQDDGSLRAKDALHIAETETALQEVYGMIADAIINRDIKKFKNSPS